MNTNRIITTIALALAGSAAFATEANVDPSYATYRRVVLGDTSVAAPKVEKAVDESGRWVPGPFALYLLVNGSSKSAALAQAASVGEHPSFVASEPVRTAREFSPYEQYQRAVLGRSDANLAGNRSSELNGKMNASITATPAR